GAVKAADTNATAQILRISGSPSPAAANALHERGAVSMVALSRERTSRRMAGTLTDILPADHATGQFIGRALSPAGPHVIAIRGGQVFDLTQEVATVSGAVARRQFSGGEPLGRVEDGLPEGWSLLTPIDLQAIKACGVTFAVFAIERVIEERAGGDASRAAEIRASLEEKIGAGIRAVVPGSAEAMSLKDALLAEGMWSQYLEVAIGPDAEVF